MVVWWKNYHLFNDIGINTSNNNIYIFAFIITIHDNRVQVEYRHRPPPVS